MHVSHHSRSAKVIPAAAERGYTMVMTALLLVPMMLFSGFAVDVGSWYNRTSDIQRAADAAALAGVVWLPDVSKASSVALIAAERNGFKNGVNNITVTVAQVGDRRLRVKITDAKVGSFFYQSVTGKTMSFSRKAVAEYVLPVPLGSPTNMIGSGNLNSSPNTENFWLAVNGYCGSRSNGDLRLAESDGNYVSGGFNCAGTRDNPDYRPTGYAYAIEANGSSGNVYVQVYDGEYSAGSNAGDYTFNGSADMTTYYRMRGPDLTPYDWTDNPILKSSTVLEDNSSWKNVWQNWYTIPAGAVGTYYLQVYTKAGQAKSWASNSFGIRAVLSTSTSTNGTPQRCTTIVGATGYSATCPQVHGTDDMSLYANFTGATAQFYLAKVLALHAGKTLELSLFDPGEGASSLQILDPDNVVTNFNWYTDCANPPTPMAGGVCEGSGTTLDLSGSGFPQPYPNMTGSYRFNDRTVVLQIPLPVGYVGGADGNGWWKIKYATGSAPTDRTTWSARIIGDPVHLVEDS